MEKISIVGDSFSANIDSEHSWIHLLSKDYLIQNYSQRGISQYRLYRNILYNLENIKKSHAVIIFHTNPDRVYIPNGIDFPSRTLSSHPCCDLVASDSLQKSSWKKIAETYYRYFYDQEQQQLYYEMLVARIKHVLDRQKTIHCSGFATLPEIKSFLQVKKKYPGDVNHCSETGNKEIYQYLITAINNETV